MTARGSARRPWARRPAWVRLESPDDYRGTRPVRLSAIGTGSGGRTADPGRTWPALGFSGRRRLVWSDDFREEGGQHGEEVEEGQEEEQEEEMSEGRPVWYAWAGRPRPRAS